MYQCNKHKLMFETRRICSVIAEVSLVNIYITYAGLLLQDVKNIRYLTIQNYLVYPQLFLKIILWILCWKRDAKLELTGINIIDTDEQNLCNEDE